MGGGKKEAAAGALGYCWCSVAVAGETLLRRGDAVNGGQWLVRTRGGRETER